MRLVLDRAPPAVRWPAFRAQRMNKSIGASAKIYTHDGRRHAKSKLVIAAAKTGTRAILIRLGDARSDAAEPDGSCGYAPKQRGLEDLIARIRRN